jgi:TrmH RNA methyltransferase
LHARRGADDLRPREERSGSWTGERKFETPFRAFDTSSDDPRTTHARARQAENDERAAAQAAREVDLAEQRRNEFRVYGLNAVLALFRSRPESIRKLWFVGSRREVLADLITYCASAQVGYNEVEAIELERIAGSEHHEGVIVAALRPDLPAASALLEQLAARTGPQLVLLLDGVANPHNLGAILRSAAHFGAAAVLLSPGSASPHSGSVYRVAEGGAEAQPVLPLTDLDQLSTLLDQGFVLAATAADSGQSLWAPGALPERLILALGAESHGISAALRERAQLQLAIPGSGAVESLNVAASAAVALAFWRSTQAV